MAVPVGTIRVNITAALGGGEQMVHTLHWRREASPESAGQQDLDDLVLAIRDEWTRLLLGTIPGQTQGLQGFLYNQTIYQRVDAYLLDVNGRSLAQAQASFSDTAAGNAGNALPHEVALVVTLETGFPGRRARGRLYMGGFGQGVCAVNGRVDAVMPPLVAQGLSRFLEVLGADGFNAVVLSRVGTSVRAITALSVGDVWDVQRRRRNKLVERRARSQVAA